MAAAFARTLGAGGVEVLSAGSAPAERVNPQVETAMREVGIDLSASRPRRVREEDVRASDVVVTMGCGDACPVFPGGRYEDWAIDDPAGRPLDDVRRIRDAIRLRVVDLLVSLGVPRPT
jgi:protein-tyrosine-phosphatase